MKLLNEGTRKLIRKFIREDENYQDFFEKELEKTGKTIEDMSDAEKKEFFNKIDQDWKAKNEASFNNGFNGLMESLKPGDILIHKHYPQYSIELIEPTNKGWKVYEMEKTKRKVKKKIAYYYSGDVSGERALFEPVNDINSNSIRENKTNNMKNRIRQVVREELGKRRGNKRTLNEGRGNWVARYDGAWWPTYYIEWPYEDDLEDGYTADIIYDDVLGNMKYMSSMKKFQVKPTSPKSFDRDSTVRFENYTLKIIFADNEWSLAVGIVPNEYFYDDALEHGEDREFLNTFNIQASAILNDLSGLYSLKEPSGAWMSSPVKGKIKVNM